LSEVEGPASRRRRGLVLLADAELDQIYAVSGIYERDRRLLEFLEHRGVRPGAKLRLVERNYDQTLTLSTPAGTVSLGPAASQRVWLSRAPRPKH
jgi:DtxR family transcriptional regulator, iron-dependent repressor